MPRPAGANGSPVSEQFGIGKIFGSSRSDPTVEVVLPLLTVQECLGLLQSTVTSTFDLQQAKVDGRVSRAITFPEEVSRQLTAIFLEVYVQLDLAIGAGETELRLVLAADPHELSVLAESFLILAEYKRVLAVTGVASEVEPAAIALFRDLAAAVESQAAAMEE